MNKHIVQMPEVYGNLTVVIGMPGSGKTTYMKSVLVENPEVLLFDDYQNESYDDDGDPKRSKYYKTLIEGLKQGKTALVSDIRYCSQYELNLFLSAVLSAAPNSHVEYRYFENNPDKCRANVITRGRAKDRIEKELEWIEKLSVQYSVPITHQMTVFTSEP